MSAISTHRWTKVRKAFIYTFLTLSHSDFAFYKKCYLCDEVEGAVIRCGDCTREYHASCAWKHGHRFGFEIQPVCGLRSTKTDKILQFPPSLFLQVKLNRRDSTIMVNFKGESGCMVALICCKEHDRSKRDMYDICETDEGGEVLAFTFF